MRTGLTIGALLVVVAGLWWAAATSGDPSSASSPAISETPATPAAPITARPEPTLSKPSLPSPEPPPTAATVPTSESAAAQPRAATEAPIVAAVPPPQAQGPVERLKQQFASEPRDSGANAIESRVQAAFRDPTIPPSVLAAVLCRKTICKLEIRWTEDHNTAYMLGLSRLLPDLSTDLAITPAGPRDGSGAIPVEVYWGRKPAASP
jgi:hypothetical protein